MKKYNFPIYAISNNGEYGLSLNFSRLAWCRPGYGYTNIPDITIEENEPEKDGIYLCSLDSNYMNLLLSIKQISNIQRLESMNNAIHYFNHLSFSPSGKRFLFLHLWVKGKNRFSRLITSNINGDNINILNNNGYTSHYCWKNDDSILSYSEESILGKNYFVYNDENCNVELFANGEIKHDSHPSFSKDTNKLLYDCYPNRIKNQNLYIYYNKNKKIYKIKSFYNPTVFKGEIRCDLHPRWNNSGNLICCDSPNLNEFRSIYVLKGIK